MGQHGSRTSDRKTGGAHDARRSSHGRGREGSAHAQRDRSLAGPPQGGQMPMPGSAISDSGFIPAPRTDLGVQGMVVDGVYLPEVPPLLQNMRGQSYNIGMPGLTAPMATSFPIPPMATSFQSPAVPASMTPMPAAMPSLATPGLMTGQSYHIGAGHVPPAVVHPSVALGGPVARGSPPPTQAGLTGTAGYAAAFPSFALGPGFGASYVAPPVVSGFSATMPFAPTMPLAQAQYMGGSSYVPPAGQIGYSSYVPPANYATSMVAPTTVSPVMAYSTITSPVVYERGYEQSIEPIRIVPVRDSFDHVIPLRESFARGFDRGYSSSVAPIQSFEREEGLTRERPIARAGNDSIIGERQVTRDELFATGNLVEGDAVDHGRNRQPAGYSRSYEQPYDTGRRHLAVADTLSSSYKGGYDMLNGSYKGGYREPARAANAEMVRSGITYSDTYAASATRAGSTYGDTYGTSGTRWGGSVTTPALPAYEDSMRVRDIGRSVLAPSNGDAYGASGCRWPAPSTTPLALSSSEASRPVAYV